MFLLSRSNFIKDLFRLEMNTFSFQEIELLVSKRELIKLLEQDQLNNARSTGQGFSELEENKPSFPPTFKYKVSHLIKFILDQSMY